jgi:tetraacyldisaccharide 4'-kinase
VFRVTRTIGAPRLITASRDSVVVPGGSRVYLVTGIARPERFEADVAAAGWEIADVMMFRDHHPFDARDVRRMAAAAQAARSAIILTTEKDAVRLAACDLGTLPIAAVPLVVAVEPAERFRDWLFERIGRPVAAEAPR